MTVYVAWRPLLPWEDYGWADAVADIVEALQETWPIQFDSRGPDQQPDVLVLAYQASDHVLLAERYLLQTRLTQLNIGPHARVILLACGLSQPQTSESMMSELVLNQALSFPFDIMVIRCQTEVDMGSSLSNRLRVILRTTQGIGQQLGSALSTDVSIVAANDNPGAIDEI